MKLSARGRRELYRVKVGNNLVVLCSFIAGGVSKFEILYRNTSYSSTYHRKGFLKPTCTPEAAKAFCDAFAKRCASIDAQEAPRPEYAWAGAL